MIGRYDEKITRQLFFSMVPLQILLVMCGGVSVIIDSAFASNLIGPDAMAAAGLYGPLAKFLDTVNALMFGGAQIMCGKYLGENVLKRAKSIFTLDMVTTVMLGLAGTVLFMFFPNIASGFCVKPGNPLAGDLMIYLTGIATGVIPYLVGTQLLAFLQLEKKEKLGFAGIGGMFVLNAVLDYVFIAVMDMGIYGLGLAMTTLSQRFVNTAPIATPMSMAAPNLLVLTKYINTNERSIRNIPAFPRIEMKLKKGVKKPPATS